MRLRKGSVLHLAFYGDMKLLEEPVSTLTDRFFGMILLEDDQEVNV